MEWVIALLVALGTPDTQRSRPELPLAVVMPLGGDGLTERERAAVSELLTTLVLRSGRYRAVGRSDIEALLGLEKARDLMGCDSTTCTAEIGSAMGAGLLITGSLRSLGQKLVLTVQLLDTRSALPKSRVSRTIARSGEAVERELAGVLDELFGTGRRVIVAGADGAASQPGAAGVAAASREVAAEPAQTIAVHTEIGRLLVVARGRGPATENDPLARLSLAKRQAVRMALDEMTRQLTLPPYDLDPVTARARAQGAQQEFSIESDGSVSLTLTLQVP